MATGGKIVVITGASDGIGKAIASELADDDHHVVLLSKSGKSLKAAASRIKGSTYFVCDISDAAAVDQTIKAIVKRHGGIDVLVNNAGVWIEGELDKNSIEGIRKTFEVNALGHIHVTRAVVPIMKKQKNGVIVNIVSQGGMYGKAARSVYCATKFAIAGFTKSLQPELGAYGIRVTGIYPGKVRTALFSKAGIKKGMDDAIEPSDVAEAVAFVVSRPDRINIPELGIKNVFNI